MIEWWRAKEDAVFMRTFRDNALKLLDIEAASGHIGRGFSIELNKQAQIQNAAMAKPEYNEIREKVSGSLLRAIEIGRKHRVPIDLDEYPPPAVGGPVVHVNAFYALLHDTSRMGLNPLRIRDGLSLAVSACELHEKKEFRDIFNPFAWLKKFFVYVIRIPFMVFSASGFNVSKIEDHFLGKLFKLVEVAIIVYGLTRLGLKIQTVEQFLAVIK